MAHRNSVDYPASISQRRILDHQRNHPAQAGDTCLAFLLTGAVDPTAWHDALQAVVDTHEILRTRFVLRDQNWFLRVEARASLHYEHLSLRPTEMNGAAEIARAEVMRRIGSLLDLDGFPLVRFFDFEREDDKKSRIIVIYGHHAILDGASLLILMQAILQSYAQRGLPVGSSTSPQFFDFVRRQSLAKGGSDWLISMRYWGQELRRGCQRIRTLRRADQGKRTAHDRATSAATFSPRHQLGLAEFSGASGIKPSAYYLAVYAAVLHLFSGQSTISIGAPYANRPQQDEKGMLGFLANVLPVRIDLERNPALVELGRDVGQRLACGYGHANVPAAELSERFDPEWHAGGGQLSNVIYNFFPMKECNWTLGELCCRPLVEATPPVLFYWYDLALTIVQQGESCQAILVYFNDTLDATEAEAFLGAFVSISEWWVKHPELRVGELRDFGCRGEDESRP